MVVRRGWVGGSRQTKERGVVGGRVMSGGVCGSIAWNERVSAAARGQQSRRTGKQTLAGRLFGCEEAGTMRRDETLSPAKEGRSPGRPGNDKKQTVYCSAPSTTGTAKNTLISSSWSSNDLRTLPASLPVHHLLSAPTINHHREQCAHNNSDA